MYGNKASPGNIRLPIKTQNIHLMFASNDNYVGKKWNLIIIKMTEGHSTNLVWGSGSYD